MIQSLVLRGAEHSGFISQKGVSKKLGCSAAVSETGLTLVVKYVLKQSPKQRTASRTLWFCSLAGLVSHTASPLTGILL